MYDKNKMYKLKYKWNFRKNVFIIDAGSLIDVKMKNVEGISTDNVSTDKIIVSAILFLKKTWNWPWSYFNLHHRQR